MTSPPTAPSTPSPSASPTPRPILYLALIALVVVAAEIMSYAAIVLLNGRLDEPIYRTRRIYADQTALIERLLDTHGEARDVIDPVLGWRYRPSFVDAQDRVTAQGLRGTREYADTIPPGVVRVAAFGDSFVYGTEVAPGEAWPRLVEDAHADLELMNYGVGGYGTDQALLRYALEGGRLHPDLVLIGFAPPDLRRTVNVYRRFISVREGLAVKPRFRRQADGTLDSVATPITSPDDWRRYLERPSRIRELGVHDQWYEPLVYRNILHDYSATVRLAVAVWIRVKRRALSPNRIVDGGQFHAASEAFALQLALFASFVEAVRRDGRRPMILFLPDRETVVRAADGGPSTYRVLRDSVEARGLPFWDARDAFPAASAPADIPDWFAPGGHYSPAGNQLVATWVGTRLQGLPGAADGPNERE